MTTDGVVSREVRLAAVKRALLAEKRRRRADLSEKDWYGEYGKPKGREAQLEPPGDWSFWNICGGRGSGKTITAANYWRMRIKRDGVKDLCFIARTEADVRDTMVTGPSGILSVWHPQDKDAQGKVIGMPRYIQNQRRVEFPNGAVINLYSTNRPDMGRGGNFSGIWWDEFAASLNLTSCWNTFMATLRRPCKGGVRAVFSTTPRPIPRMRALQEDPNCVVTRMTSYENKDNLDPVFYNAVIKPMEGTALYRQEVLGETLIEIDGALWKYATIEKCRLPAGSIRKEDCSRIIVAIDPAVTAAEDSNETGIVVIGQQGAERAYVLEDVSGIYSPDAWANRAVHCYHKWKADLIIAEKNQGGDMVQSVIKSADKSVPVFLVHAARGKYSRAEPIAALYEQGRVFHVGIFEELEGQQCSWVPGFTTGKHKNQSLDRVDALVWGITYSLLKVPGGGSFISPIIV